MDEHDRHATRRIRLVDVLRVEDVDSGTGSLTRISQVERWSTIGRWTGVPGAEYGAHRSEPRDNQVWMVLLPSRERNSTTSVTSASPVNRRLSKDR